MKTAPTLLPDALKEILDSTRAFAHLTTLDPDGSPQATAMWVMRQDEMILMNTAEGRRKHRNLQRDPRVAISISKHDDPYSNFSIQGRVVEMRTSDGVEVIDALARKYLDGVDRYPWLQPGMVRVTLVIEPTRIAANG
ncbi:MAG: PPOX class F420-dependent oxidoreductase [Acidimicrobiia bacterium]|nr:MAG: PPOX class F420-dependent oxidoreductase [Acidimicrobiia bacterium]